MFRPSPQTHHVATQERVEGCHHLSTLSGETAQHYGHPLPVLTLVTNSPSDASLVTAAANGDSSAFVTFVRRHDSTLRAIAYSVTGNANDMDDVLQEALLKAFRSLRTNPPTTNPKAWLCRITHNSAIDHARRRKNVIPIDTTELTETPSPLATSAEQITDRLTVHEALAQLPEAQRTALRLIDGEQLPYTDVAEMLQIPLGTLATRVRTARQALRTILAPHFTEERTDATNEES